MSTRLCNRAGAPPGLVMYVSLVPMWSRMMFGAYCASDATNGTIWSMVKPLWPSWLRGNVMPETVVGPFI